MTRYLGKKGVRVRVWFTLNSSCTPLHLPQIKILNPVSIDFEPDSGPYLVNTQDTRCTRIEVQHIPVSIIPDFQNMGMSADE
jgi:hypothetical protein